ncbi:unnamed protein product [Mesocestoides corti]|uniref:Secreted protein n=1 Tax=Mesocestoides corti TaxID=53468 RepID=A0A0R3URG5_MESCO|nr:unnamed protein product [Mesocestoides corti]
MLQYNRDTTTVLVELRVIPSLCLIPLTRHFEYLRRRPRCGSMTAPVASSLTLFYGTRANFGMRCPMTNHHQITTFVSLTTFLILVVTATTNNPTPVLNNNLPFFTESFL